MVYKFHVTLDSHIENRQTEALSYLTYLTTLAKREVLPTTIGSSVRFHFVLKLYLEAEQLRPELVFVL